MQKPLSLFQWDGEHYEAWEQAKRYMRTKLSCTDMDVDTDSNEEEAAME